MSTALHRDLSNDATVTTLKNLHKAGYMAADTAAREAITTATEGDLCYQLDNRSWYSRDGAGAWNLLGGAATVTGPGSSTLQAIATWADPYGLTLQSTPVLVDEVTGDLKMPAGAFIEIGNGATPATPAAGYGRIFKDTADGHLKIVLEDGSVIDLLGYVNGPDLFGMGAYENDIPVWDITQHRYIKSGGGLLKYDQSTNTLLVFNGKVEAGTHQGGTFGDDHQAVTLKGDTVTIKATLNNLLGVEPTIYMDDSGNISIKAGNTNADANPHHVTIESNNDGDVIIDPYGGNVLFKRNGASTFTVQDYGANQELLVGGGSRINMNAQILTGLTTPTDDTDAASKGYVDALVQGLDWQQSVLDYTTTPPGSPATGARYLVAIGATGAWSGHDNQIATWTGSAWTFQTPNDGYAVWVEDEDKQYTFNGTAWVTFGSTDDHGSLTGLGDDDHTQYLTTGRADTWLGTKTTTNLTEGTNLYYTSVRALSDVTLSTITGTLSASKGGTGLSSYATGDLIYASGASMMTTLAIGGANTVLRTNGSVPSWGKVVLTNDVIGTLPIGNGGTGQTTASEAFGALSPLTTKGDLLGYSTANARIPVGTDGQVLTADSTQSLGLKWAAPATTGLADPGGNGIVVRTALNTTTARTLTGTASRISITNGDGTAGNPTVDIDAAYAGQASITTLGTIATGTWNATTIAVNRGGTGLTSYVAGDLIYATGTSTLARLADVATGNALISGGVGAAPSWGKIGLATHISGTLAVGNGGTGLTTFAQGDLIFASAANTLAALAKDANATRYLANTGTNNNPAWAQVNLANGVTGRLPFANLTQGSALSVLGVTGNAAADVASIAAGTDNQVLRRSGTSIAFGAVNLASSSAVTGALPIANGGTGQTTATAAFDALDPLTTKGDLISNNGTNSVRLAVGTDRQLLVADSTTATGLAWRGRTHNLYMSLCGQANNTIGMLSKHCIDTSNPSGKPTTNPFSVGFNSGDNDPFLMMDAGVITRCRIRVGGLAVAQATVGASPALRIEVFRVDFSTRTSIGTIDVPVDPGNVSVSNNLVNNDFQTAILSGLSIAYSAGDLLGFQFTNLNANNNQINAVSRLEVNVEVMDS